METPGQDWLTWRLQDKDTLALNSNILAMEGVGLRSVEMFNTSSNTWSILTSLPVDIEYGQAVTLSNNLVNAMDRNSDTVYTSHDLQTWTKTVISNFDNGEREVGLAHLVPVEL